MNWIKLMQLIPAVVQLVEQASELSGKKGEAKKSDALNMLSTLTATPLVGPVSGVVNDAVETAVKVMNAVKGDL